MTAATVDEIAPRRPRRGLVLGAGAWSPHPGLRVVAMDDDTGRPRRMLREAAKVEAGGARLTLLAPGPRDLEAVGANLPDPVRRGRVLATSLDTSVVALRNPAPDDLGIAI